MCNNRANTCGGGIYCMYGDSYISNNLLANNSLHGMRNDECYFYLRNNTIVNNEGNGIYFVSSVLFESVNDIIWGNLLGSYSYTPYVYSYSVQNSFIEDSSGVYPEFVDPTPGVGDSFNGLIADWTLSDFSPAINSGIIDTTGFLIPAYDLAGNLRICHDTIDLGAYEYCEGTWITTYETDNQVVIFPNPAKTYFIIEAEDFVRAELYDLNGRMMSRTKDNQLNIHDLQTGKYTVKIICKNRKVLKNIIVIK